MRRKRLLWQLYPFFLLVSFLSILLASWYASRSLHRFYIQRTAADLNVRAHLLQDEILKILSPLDRAGIDQQCKRLGSESGTRITVILPSGEVVGDSEENPFQMDNHAGRPEVRDALAGRIGSATRFSATLRRIMMYVAIPLKNDGVLRGVIRVALPLYSVEQPFRALRSELILGAVFLVLLAGVGSFAVSRWFTRPLEDMKQAAASFALGNLSHRVPVPNSEELGALAEVLNRLAEELGERIVRLERQRNEQEAIFSSMTEGVVALDEKERIINLNAAAAELLGINPEKTLNRSLHEAIRNSDLQKLAEKAFQSGKPVEGDVVVYKDRERNLQAHITALRSAEGQNIGALIVLNDVTRLRRLENLRRDFVANVSHELKTPITSIKGFVETLQEGAVNHPDDARRFLGIIAKHADRLNSIIEDLLSLSRVEQQADHNQVVLEQTAVKDFLNTAIQMCQIKAQSKDIPIVLDCPGDLVAKINPTLLEQAVVNLIDNAIKYSARGKPIRVEASRAADAIRLSVRDQGCGIDAEHLPRLFERFYRVDKARSRQLGGTGLGLSIVKHIALAHGGHVNVESIVGQGSTFTITLPGAS
jgi:two-component system, OmpR family, phosphate regulon sensor histidine kinase PhoR